jgi:hypothetical protein
VVVGFTIVPPERLESCERLERLILFSRLAARLTGLAQKNTAR